MSKYVCTSCRREIEGGDPPEVGGTCPACREPGAGSRNPTATIGARSGVCAFCLSLIGMDEEVAACPACHTRYHNECWQENGGCAVYGCAEVPEVEPRKAVEIPVSYWGQENKPCPGCGKEILAAAMRCRFCGATFSSAQPEDVVAFNLRTEQERRLPAAKQIIVWVFVLSLIPCFAPIGGVWGLVWYPTHKSDVQALPSLYPALCKIGIAVGLGQTVLLALLTAIYAATVGR